MAKGFYVKGFGFVEDNAANRELLIMKGFINEEPLKIEIKKSKPKKKKDDTPATGSDEHNSVNSDGVIE